MCDTLGKGKFEDDLFLVSPGESGHGLPYAPVDCPNPGDIWRWAATGKAIKKNGSFKDRFLYAPERLQKRPTKQLIFMSMKSVAHFLRSEFPEVDIDAFFQSFSWSIPAKTGPKSQENIATHSQSAASPPEVERVGRVYRKGQQSSHGQKRQRPSDDVIEIEIEDENTKEEETSENVEVKKCSEGSIGEVSNSHANINSAANGNICCPVPECKLGTSNLDLKEFDNYVNSLDEMVAVNDMLTKRRGGDFFEARKRLSSLVAFGFPTLVSTEKLNELLSLASELKNDPSLSHKELSMLKLIQEIPPVIPHYIEVKESSEKVNKFFADLESNLRDISRLKKEYTNAKQEKEVLQAEESCLLLAMMETNKEIEKLESCRMALTETIKKKNKMIVECNCIQQKVMDRLPQVVQEVQAANTKKTELEHKKKELSERLAEILAKFAPFVGFSFHKLS